MLHAIRNQPNQGRTFFSLRPLLLRNLAAGDLPLDLLWPQQQEIYTAPQENRVHRGSDELPVGMVESIGF